MLVLSRKKGETIVIDGNIEVTILDTEGDSVRIGINAPKHIDIYRQEVFLAIQQSNQEAARTIVNPLDLKIFDKK
ncbi:carbon storage regulator CsrA [Paenibacillus sp. N1-5-1-14]|uniref:carbon storage regulator CsrA n=1 Tax=Paenibacillus radicibacter TaxID=2972488 RepID=UPI002158F1A7|nr:carbon storage regulator CsrA [Paenibacillus radicibacter]MCR8645039.1 carbon storage regulator CsrA [Paenibacillus radicibacter]